MLQCNIILEVFLFSHLFLRRNIMIKMEVDLNLLLNKKLNSNYGFVLDNLGPTIYKICTVII